MFDVENFLYLKYEYDNEQRVCMPNVEFMQMLYLLVHVVGHSILH